MGDSERTKFREAQRLWSSRDIERAITLHRELAQNARDCQVRLQSSLILIERLNPVDHLEDILMATSAGEESARSLGDEMTRAYVLAKRAEALVMLNGVTLVGKRTDLRMAPGWFAFSLEQDKLQFQNLTKEIDKNDSEADRLLKEAVLTKSASTRAHVLMCAARINGHRYLTKKLECVKVRRWFPTTLIRLLRQNGVST